MQKSDCLYVSNQLGMFYGLFLCYIASQVFFKYGFLFLIVRLILKWQEMSGSHDQ